MSPSDSDSPCVLAREEAVPGSAHNSINSVLGRQLGTYRSTDFLIQIKLRRKQTNRLSKVN